MLASTLTVLTKRRFLLATTSIVFTLTDASSVFAKDGPGFSASEVKVLSFVFAIIVMGFLQSCFAGSPRPPENQEAAPPASGTSVAPEQADAPSRPITP
jgi:hypothetical protein